MGNYKTLYKTYYTSHLVISQMTHITHRVATARTQHMFFVLSSPSEAGSKNLGVQAVPFQGIRRDTRPRKYSDPRELNTVTTP